MKERMSDKKEIMVSVIVLTYNHSNYIEQALNSIVTQETDFLYEVLVGDDCSTDNTQVVISEFVQRYPQLIKAELREKNIGGKENMYDLMMKCKGKYVAFLEGDDYWCDTKKLQKQVTFLENHPEYIACAHKFHVVNQEGKEYFDRDFLIQFVDGNKYSVKDFEKGKLVSHLNAIVYRNIYAEKRDDFFHFWLEFDNMAGDVVINLVLAIMGNVYCFDEVMSCYRKVTHEGSSSFSAMQEKQNKRDILYKSQIDLERLIEKRFNKKVSFELRKKNIFASAVFKWNRDKDEKNRVVVENIIKYSERPMRYRLFKAYLLCMKKILWLIYKEDKRVPF